MSLSLNEEKYYNLPKQVPISDYVQVRDLVVERLKDNQNLKAIYLAGSDWVPGISDMDILLIYKDELNQKIPIPAPWSLSDKAAYLFTHNYGTYSQSDFKNIFYLIPDQTKLELLFGETIAYRRPGKELNSNEYSWLNAITVFDLLVNKLLLFTGQYNLQPVNVRKNLAVLGSLTHTVKMMSFLGLDMGIDFCERIARLRNNWFEDELENNLKELEKLMEKGMDLILLITDRLTNFVRTQGITGSSLVKFSNRQYYISFTDDWSPELFIDSFNKGNISIRYPGSKRTRKNYRYVLPAPLAYFISAYASQEGPLSSFINKNSPGLPKAKVNFNRGIIEHISNSNDYVSNTINNKGLYKIPFPYGGVYSRRTAKSKAVDLMIKITRQVIK